MTIQDLNRFIDALNNSRRIVAFTGAGISTESGIPDYRSQGGIWDRFKPVYFNEFINDKKKRRLYWERKISLWQGLKKAKPGIAHAFFKSLYDQGRLTGLITQNIDGLHEKSGLPGDMIVNLHGSNLEIACIDCGDILPAETMMDALDLDQGSPRCGLCKGLLKPNTISFGQSLVPEDLDRAEQLALSCDLMIAAGSTLAVQPAASFPVIAKNNGAVLAIMTLSETPLDRIADFVFQEKLGEFLQKITGL